MKLDKTVNDDSDRLLALIARRGGRLVWTRDRDGRWYQAQILVDLFDTTELRLRWGGPLRSRGGGMTYCLDGLDGNRIKALVTRLCKRRRQHGYTRLPDTASHGERLQRIPTGTSTCRKSGSGCFCRCASLMERSGLARAPGRRQSRQANRLEPRTVHRQ